MSILASIARWLHLETDAGNPRAGGGRDLRGYDASERRMEARVRGLEGRVRALVELQRTEHLARERANPPWDRGEEREEAGR